MIVPENKMFNRIELMFDETYVNVKDVSFYLKSNSKSDYLLGLLVALKSEREGRLETETFIENHIKRLSIDCWNTYIYWGMSIYHKYYGNKQQRLKYLLKSKEHDTNIENRYLFLEYYDYYYHENIKDAYHYLTKGIDLFPNCTILKIEQAYYLKSEGYFDKANEIIDEVILKVNHPSAYYFKSITLYEEEGIHASLYWANLGLKQKETPELHRHLGFLINELGQSDKAIIHFTKALELNDYDKQSNINIAWHYVNNDLVTKALEYFIKAKECYPQNEIEDFVSIFYCYLLLDDLSNASKILDYFTINKIQYEQFDMLKLVYYLKKQNKLQVKTSYSEFVENYGIEKEQWLIKQLNNWGFILT